MICWSAVLFKTTMPLSTVIIVSGNFVDSCPNSLQSDRLNIKPDHETVIHGERPELVSQLRTLL